MVVFAVTQAQYILIHQALLEHNQFGETEITLPELHSTLSTLRQRGSPTEPTLMQDEFEVRNLFFFFFSPIIFDHLKRPKPCIFNSK